MASLTLHRAARSTEAQEAAALAVLRKELRVAENEALNAHRRAVFTSESLARDQIRQARAEAEQSVSKVRRAARSMMHAALVRQRRVLERTLKSKLEAQAAILRMESSQRIRQMRQDYEWLCKEVDERRPGARQPTDAPSDRPSPISKPQPSVSPRGLHTQEIARAHEPKRPSLSATRALNVNLRKEVEGLRREQVLLEGKLDVERSEHADLMMHEANLRANAHELQQEILQRLDHVGSLVEDVEHGAARREEAAADTIRQLGEECGTLRAELNTVKAAATRAEQVRHMIARSQRMLIEGLERDNATLKRVLEAKPSLSVFFEQTTGTSLSDQPPRTKALHASTAQVEVPDAMFAGLRTVEQSLEAAHDMAMRAEQEGLHEVVMATGITSDVERAAGALHVLRRGGPGDAEGACDILADCLWAIRSAHADASKARSDRGAGLHDVALAIEDARSRLRATVVPFVPGAIAEARKDRREEAVRNTNHGATASVETSPKDLEVHGTAEYSNPKGTPQPGASRAPQTWNGILRLARGDRRASQQLTARRVQPEVAHRGPADPQLVVYGGSGVDGSTVPEAGHAESKSSASERRTSPPTQKSAALAPSPRQKRLLGTSQSVSARSIRNRREAFAVLRSMAMLSSLEDDDISALLDAGSLSHGDEGHTFGDGPHEGEPLVWIVVSGLVRVPSAVVGAGDLVEAAGSAYVQRVGGFPSAAKSRTVVLSVPVAAFQSHPAAMAALEGLRVD